MHFCFNISPLVSWRPTTDVRMAGHFLTACVVVGKIDPTLYQQVCIDVSVRVFCCIRAAPIRESVEALTK